MPQARANVVGIAPRVAGQILKLNVQDNQAVKEGDGAFRNRPGGLPTHPGKGPKLIWPPWIDRLHKRVAACGAWNRSYPRALRPPKTSMKPELKLTTLQAQREGVVATINLEELHLSYCKGHRAFFPDVSSISTFRPAPMLPPGFLSSRCSTRAKMVRHREFSRRPRFDIWLPAAKRSLFFVCA